MRFGSCPIIHYDLRMRIPLPIRTIRHLLTALPYPVMMIGGVIFGLLFCIYFLAGVVFGDPNYKGWASEMERTAFVIITSVIPAYLFMCLTAATRLNQEVYGFLYSQIHDQGDENELLLRYTLGRYWLGAILLGVWLATSNINWSGLNFKPDDGEIAAAALLLSGNFIIWCSVTIVLFFFLLEGHSYHQLGKKIPIDLYNLDSLNGFGRVSLGGFLMVMSALALSTLQSLDQEFNLGRYTFALIVGLPASIVLVMLPSWSVHRRLRREKKRHLNEISSEIQAASKSLDGDALMRMNGLLARKNAVEGVRTWPMDLSIFSRFILYVFIPPLAWIGAALMEIFLDSYIAG